MSLFSTHAICEAHRSAVRACAAAAHHAPAAAHHASCTPCAAAARHAQQLHTTHKQLHHAPPSSRRHLPQRTCGRQRRDAHRLGVGHPLPQAVRGHNQDVALARCGAGGRAGGGAVGGGAGGCVGDAGGGGRRRGRRGQRQHRDFGLGGHPHGGGDCGERDAVWEDGSDSQRCKGWSRSGPERELRHGAALTTAHPAAHIHKDICSRLTCVAKGARQRLTATRLAAPNAHPQAITSTSAASSRVSPKARDSARPGDQALGTKTRKGPAGLPYRSVARRVTRPPAAVMRCRSPGLRQAGEHAWMRIQCWGSQQGGTQLTARQPAG